MSVNFKLDKTAFDVLSFDDADKKISQYKNNTWQERLIIANYLTAIAYNYSLNNPPKLDKTFFEIRKYNG